MLVFPVAKSGNPQFAEAFNASHHGTDIFAQMGTPLLAVDSGTARAANDPKGGAVIYLKAHDGTTYYYAHLASYVGSFPREVKAGEVIGKVGDSGNAKGKTPHLHFEIHPGGGEAVNPFPELTRTFSQLQTPPTPVASKRSGAGLVAALAIGVGIFALTVTQKGKR